MRIKKVFTIIVLFVLFLAPFGERMSIQSATAKDVGSPGGDDGRRLDQDTVDEDLGELPLYKPVTSPQIVDETLGQVPSFIPPQDVGVDLREENKTPNLPLSTGIDLGENPLYEPDTGPEIVDETLGHVPSFAPSQNVGEYPQAPTLSSDQPGLNSELNYGLLPGLSVLDNFNRPDGAIGSNWTVQNGSCNVSSNAAVCGSSARATFNGAPGNGNSAEADVATVGTSVQYTGLLLNYGAGVSNLFIKVQQQSPNLGQFTNAACYTGNNGSAFGLGIFALTSPFSTAHMKATRAGDTVTIVFSNIDGGVQPSQTYVCSGAPIPEGTGVGIVGYNATARLDNFSLPSQCNTELYDNGPIVTHPGGGYNGADASAVQSALGMGTYGFGNQFSVGNRLADDFVVSDPGGWQVDYLTFYAYQNATYPDPPPSTITGIYFQIWNGPPNDPGSSVIFGDLTTNRMVSTDWSYIYRVLDTALTNATRPPMANVAGAGIYLPPGTYWLDWMIDGSGPSGPWTPPITILGQTTTGNSMQYTGAWGPTLDTSLGTQQGLPFVVQGCAEKTLWDQPLSSVNQNAYVSQDFPDGTTASSYLADDFISDKFWSIDTIFIPGGGWNGFTTLANASALNFQIYADKGSFPAGDPSGGGDPPLWALTLPVTDPHITLYTGSMGMPSNALLRLPVPIGLSPGRYWLVFFPTMNFSLGGQYGRQPADTTNGSIGKFINPGNGFGYGTAWQNWSVIGPAQSDIAFRLGGKAGLWQQISTDPISRMDNVLAAYNGKIWGITGYGSTGVSNYTPATGIWSTVASSAPPFGQNYARSGCQVGNKVFVYGDTATVGFTGLWSYNMDTNAWNGLTPTGTPPAYTGIWAPSWVADTATGLCYMTGGATAPGNGNLSTVYVYNAVTNNWLPALPNFTSARDFHAAFLFTRPADSHKLLCVAGGLSGVVRESTQCYDLNTASWHAENADLGVLPTGWWGMGYTQSPTANGARLWMVNGADAAYALYDQAWFYSVATNTWVNTGSLQSGVFYRTSAVTLNGTAYHIGGSSGGFSPSGLSDKFVGFPIYLPSIKK
jgi:hypothetical protein